MELNPSQLAFTCSKTTLETPEQCVKTVLLATCARKPKVPRSSPAASYVQR